MGLGITPHGTLANGAARKEGSQCLTGSCDAPGGASCGTCAPTAAVGQTCGVGMPTCDDGLYCDPGTNKCQQKKVSGGACVTSSECTGNLVCANGQCGDGLGPNGDCSGANKDACDFWNQGLICDQNMKCTAVAIDGLNQPCGLDPMTLTAAICTAELYCSAQVSGTCLARKAKNDACTVDPNILNGDNCLPYLSCINNVCVTKPDITCP